MSLDSVQGWKVLAASYDKSALLWQRDEPVPKVTTCLSVLCGLVRILGDLCVLLCLTCASHLSQLTLTGHRRKVTAARFGALPHQVVTGSADRTIRWWDLHRAACESPVTDHQSVTSQHPSG